LELLPIGRKNLAPLSIGELILYYGLLFVMTILVKRKKHPYQLAFVLASIFILLFPRIPGFSVWVLDVGQGDCNVIFTEEGHCFVIDCGSTSKKMVGEKVLIPFLKYHGINRVDGIIITHPDADHMNGIVNLLETGQEENIEITCVYIYEKGIENESAEWEEMLTLAQKQKIPLWGIGQGDILQTDGFFMECMYPLAGQEGLTGNGASLVMKVECGDFRGLFTGDLEIEGEQKLLEFYRNQKREEEPAIGLNDTKETLFGENTYNFLKVGHHGSSGSGSEAFLQWVNPDYAVISCGATSTEPVFPVFTYERYLITSPVFESISA